MEFQSKIYSNIIAGINESKLLGKEKLRRLIEADFSDAVKMLADYGFGGGFVNESSYDIDNFITDETVKLITFIEEDCPDKGLKNCLINKYRYSDAKVYYKSKFVKFEIKPAVYGCFPEIEKAIESNELAALPVLMAETINFLNIKYADKPAAPKEIDVVFTEKMYEDNICSARSSKNKSLLEYIKTEIDYHNILAAYRYKSLRLDISKFSDDFISGGQISEEIISSVFSSDGNIVLDAFSDTKYYDTIKKLSETPDFAIFERNFEDTLYEIMSAGNDNMMTLSPFINYCLKKANELKTVKTILVCLKNNARNEISKRIRSLND